MNTDPRTAAFAGYSFAANVAATAPVFAERAMYFNGFEGGHSATGSHGAIAHVAVRRRLHGKGLLHVLPRQQPQCESRHVTLTYFLDNGTTVERTRPIAPSARETVFVNFDPELQSAAFATRITSTCP